MPNRTIYFYDDVYEHLTSQPEVSKYLNNLVRNQMGVPPETVEKPEKVVAKENLLENLPKGVSLGLVRPDRPVCKVCGNNLDSLNRCSNKGCKKFLKVV
jgi:hypothetical protein